MDTITALGHNRRLLVTTEVDEPDLQEVGDTTCVVLIAEEGGHGIGVHLDRKAAQALTERLIDILGGGCPSDGTSPVLGMC